MNKKSTTVIIVGSLILVVAFSYSWFGTITGRVEYVATSEFEPAVRELMPMMDGDERFADMMSYKDGLYTTVVNYEIPYGYIEPMEVTLAVDGGVVNEVSIAFEVVNPVSKGYQQSFNNYFRGEVVGKNLNDISLSRVAGASLTSRAFGAALEDIKEQATSMQREQTEEAVSITLPPIPSVETSKFVINSVSSKSFDNQTLYTIDHSYTINQFLTEPMITSITVVDDIITKAAVVFDSPDQISIMHQQAFADRYREQIIGQPVGSASLSRVSYASLTTKAFNDALDAIRSKQINNET